MSGHWSVENIRWQLDVTIKEDANTTLDKCSTKSEIHMKMVFEYYKDGGDKPFQPVYEEETVYNQYESEKVLNF